MPARELPNQPTNQPTNQPVKLESDRVITAAFIRYSAKVFEEMLKTGHPRGIDYHKVVARILENPKFKDINPATVLRKLITIYPRSNLVNEESPIDLAEEFLSDNPKYLIPEKLELAAKLLRQPGTTVNSVAKKVSLPNSTLTHYLRQAGLTGLSQAQKGLRIVYGKGKDPNEPNYGHYFSVATVERAAQLLQRVNGNRQQALELFIKEFGTSSGQDLINDVFSAYLLQNGISFCLERYKKWAQTYKKVRPSLNEEQLARREILNVILQALRKETIPNSNLFLRIAFEILIGKRAYEIAEEYKISELTIVAIRKRMEDYITDYELDRKKLLRSELEKTKWFDSFEEQWVSEPNRDIARNQFIEVARRFREDTQIYTPLPNNDLVKSFAQRKTTKTLASKRIAQTHRFA